MKNQQRKRYTETTLTLLNLLPLKLNLKLTEGFVQVQGNGRRIVIYVVSTWPRQHGCDAIHPAGEGSCSRLPLLSVNGVNSVVYSTISTPIARTCVNDQWLRPA